MKERLKIHNIFLIQNAWSTKGSILLCNDEKILVNVVGISGNFEYEKAYDFFRNWEILDRRILLEKSGYYI